MKYEYWNNTKMEICITPMTKTLQLYNLNEIKVKYGHKTLREMIETFECGRNTDIERFVRKSFYKLLYVYIILQYNTYYRHFEEEKNGFEIFT